ncbi:uncharacterized protein CTRU02_200634 [Colletotrichum truncatum]|uniref:Uncharacterized protein n=1 Tax=Colletotrichum truncatum TaxID=5467 RepID=A0ACC3ZF29_COLTU|nr:uncharacterized protein CTRU02_00396 [Colletotrichum truncatum]KAF6801647.1 hypothetical protein CTRU02_00396 [Colletotrichum truncatum]
MAAPDSKTIRDLTGTWIVNRSLSNDLSDTLAMQGLSWITRKVLTTGGIKLVINQSPLLLEKAGSSPVSTLHQEQTVTPGNFKSEDVYVLDGVERDQKTQVFGALVTNVKFVPIDEARDDNVSQRLRESGVTEVIEEFSSSKKAGWSTLTTWALEEVDSQRRFTQSSTTEKNGKSVTVRLVYDYSG